MADGLVAPVLVGPGGVRTAIESVVTARQNLERATVALGEERTKKVADKIDAFVNAAKNAVAPAEAVRTQLDLEALKKTFDDQEHALGFWQRELTDRLNELADRAGPEVISVLNSQIADLREQQAKEQGDVNKVASLIAEFEALIKTIQYGGGATAQKGKSRRKQVGGGKGKGVATDVKIDSTSGDRSGPPLEK
jgi:hypothetical protein